LVDPESSSIHLIKLLPMAIEMVELIFIDELEKLLLMLIKKLTLSISSLRQELNS
jgi:hypothetical protein